MSEIEWAERAPVARNVNNEQPGLPKVYRTFRTALRERPGKWAKWPVTLHTAKAAEDVAYQINTDRRPTTFPAEEFDARVDEAFNLWVRARPKKKGR